MTAKELRGIRLSMGLRQAKFAERIRVSRVSVARMETGLTPVTPSMALLIEYVAKDHEAVDSERGRRRAGDKRKHGPAARPTRGQARPGQGTTTVQKRGRRGVHRAPDRVRKPQGDREC